MASPRQGGRSEADRLNGRRAALFVSLAAASSNAFASSDPFVAIVALIVLGGGAGALTCIVVELVAGRGGRLARAGIGLGFAVLDVVLFFLVLVALINVTEGASPWIFSLVGSWVVPVLRLWWLLRKPRAPA